MTPTTPEQEKSIGTNVKFTRTRRITGYLVGSLDRWSNAKKAELKDRRIHV
jgi:anaerobic ribonucleoside-triphosphate reductase